MGVRGGLLCGNEVGTLEEMKAQLGWSLGSERPQGENGYRGDWKEPVELGPHLASSRHHVWLPT